MISQFFVVSMRGDTILHKDCKSSYLLYKFYNAYHECSPPRDGKLSTDNDLRHVFGARGHHKFIQ